MDQLLSNFENVDDTSMPAWAKILIDGLKIIITELKCVKDLAKRLDEFEAFKAVSETTTKRLADENKRLNERLNQVELKQDDQEQRSRSYCLMIHGCEETEGENVDEVVLDVVNKYLEINDFCVDDIVRSHRTGPRQAARSTRKNPTKPRPIIFRLGNYRDRRNIFTNKRKLKGTGLTITENLTKRRTDLLKLAQNKLGYGNVWTGEGRVTAKLNDKYVVINSEADL